MNTDRQRIADLEAELAHWRQRAIDLAAELDLTKQTLDAIIDETTED